jgi:mannose-1-phosphate guanylyltransferase/mannose-6-phosphate isomerase
MKALPGERYQVKRIFVNPGAALSLQYHHHRAEHWVVVSGTARVTRGEEVFDLSPNQSTYIPLARSTGLKTPEKKPGTHRSSVRRLSRRG